MSEIQGLGAPQAVQGGEAQPNGDAFAQQAAKAKLMNDMAVQGTETMGMLMMSMAQQMLNNSKGDEDQ